MSQATVCKTAKVPDDAYRALHSRDSLPFSSIVSTKPIADFNAPSASNRMNRAADLPMLRDAAARNDYRLPREAWRGVLADVKHKMIVCKMAAKPTDPNEYFVAGYHFPQSSVCGWPVKLNSFDDDGGAEFFDPITDGVNEPCLFPMFSLEVEKFRACTYTWTSWTSQQLNYPKSATKLSPALRWFV